MTDEATVRQPQVGDAVIYHLPDATPVNALVICTWQGAPVQMTNVMYVSPDESRQDSYGRQFERATSVHHKSAMKVHGNYWRWPDEEPNPVVQPMQK